MDNLLASIISDILEEPLKKSSEKTRYILVTICMIFLVTISVLGLVKQTNVEFKIALGIFILFLLLLYVFTLIKIYKHFRKKNKKIK